MVLTANRHLAIAANLDDCLVGGKGENHHIAVGHLSCPSAGRNHWILYSGVVGEAYHSEMD